MEYDEEDNGATGSIPEFGAIFMSNIQTKKECYERKIFALPSSKAEFVKHIKAGMVLFLFEYRKRQLFGVYQASSDGGVDIVPHAFNYSGKRFPAQVCCTRIWHCNPLSEKEFRDAIRENYFSAKKFNFGLSEDQVRRLLYLFSSRKLTNKMPPHPPSEAIVGVAGKDRQLAGDDRLESSEKGYMEQAEYDEFGSAAFSDHHMSSLARAKENEIMIDDRVNTEGKVYPFSQEAFLAKRRRIGNDDRLVTNDVTENRIYNHVSQGTFCSDSLRDSLDEVRRFADARRLLTIESVNKNQVDRILNPVLSSDDLLDPLGVRANGDYRFMQRSRLSDEYNRQNGSRQAFTSDRYGEYLDKSKHAIDDDGFLLDDCVQRDYNIHDMVKPMAYGDGNLNLCREARDMIDDHECLMNRKLENGYRLDCACSPNSAYVNSASLLHKVKKTTAAGRFPINESVRDFGTCSVEGFSPEKISSRLQCGQGIIHDRKYPIMEGRSTRNMVDAKNARYIVSGDRSVVDDGRFRRSESLDIEEHSHMRNNPAMSMEYPYFSQPKQNLSKYADKLLPEKGDLSHPTFDDATITRAVPYLPECPNLSHGISASVAANQNHPSLVQENHLHHGSLGNFYSLPKKRPPQYNLEPEKSCRTVDIAPEFRNEGCAKSTLGHQGSLLRESGSSFVNSNLSMHMDLNTSATGNYGGSLFSKLSPPCTDLKNIGGEKGLFAYSTKSRENHFAFDGNLPMALQHVSKWVPRHEMDMLAGKDFNCSEEKDLSFRICHPERDLARHGNQDFRFSGNMNLKELRKISEAPHANFNVNRRSVFTRLTSGEESQFGEERNGIDFNHQDSYMDATADEVMEMLKQGNNLSLKKLKKSRVGGQPKHAENAVNEKKANDSTMAKKKLNDASLATADSIDKVVSENKAQCQIETNHSTMGKKKINDASLATADDIDAVPEETRTVNFKRRSDRKKILVGISADSDAHNKIAGANEEVKSSIKTTVKRRKLVRPHFSTTESASDAIHSSETLQVPDLILDKDDKQTSETAINICEAGMPNDNKRHHTPEEQKDVIAHILPSTSASSSHEPMDRNNKEHQNPEEQKDVVAHILSFTSALSAHQPIDCNNKEHQNPEEQKNVVAADILPSTSALSTHQPMDCNNKEHQNPEEQRDVVAHIFPSTSASSTHQPVHCNNKEHQNPDEQKDVVAHILPSTGTSSTRRPVDCNNKEHQNPEEQKDVVVHILPSTSASSTQPPMDCNDEEHQNPEEQKDVVARVLPSTSASSTHPPINCNNKEHENPEEQKDVVAHVLPSTSASSTHQPVDCNNKEHQNPKEQKDVVAHLLPSTSHELKECITTNVDPQIGSSEVLKETTQQKCFGIQSSAEGILAKDIDTDITGLNVQESSLEGVKHSACSGN